MAKAKTPNQKKRYAALNARLAKYMLAVDFIFDKYNKEAAKIAVNSGYDSTQGEFRFSDYPDTKKAVDELTEGFTSDMQALIYRGTSEEWKNSNLIQDLMVDDVLRTYNASKYGDKFPVYYQTNSDQLKAFQNRVDKGMNLSKRLWNQSQIYKSTLEFTIGAAIEKGMSAVVLSKKLSQFLNNYNQLKSTYAQKFGKAITPEQCQYASMRLARSEINMAYRTAEQTRWNQLDFVVGKEIKTSGAHPDHDVCDMLKGKYPKDFKWVGWHPNCYSYDTKVLTKRGWVYFSDVADDDEVLSLNPDTKRIELSRIIARQKYWYDGAMIHFVDNDYLDCLVTPDHKMVYITNDGVIKYKTADEFSQTDGSLMLDMTPSSGLLHAFKKNRQHYNGYVYDVTLEKNHIMYVMRDNKCFWCSNCMCYEIPILSTQDEFWDINNTGSVNEIKQVPDQMKQYIADNAERINNAEKRGTLPYWIRDNHWITDRKEAIQHVAEVRHEKRNDAAIQAKWDARRARIEEESKPKLTPVEQAAQTRHEQRNAEALTQRINVRKSMTQTEREQIAYVRHLADKYGVDRSQLEAVILNAKDKSDILKAADALKAEIVQKRAAIRHAQRPDGYAEQITKTRRDNMSTLKYANGVEKYMSGISDVDLSALQQAIKSGDYQRMLAEANNIRAIGKSIKGLKNIDDPMSVARQYSLAEAKAVDAAIGSKLNQWSSITDLDQLRKKVDFEINWIDTHRKYNTWSVSKKAFEKKLAEVDNQIFFRDATNNYNTLAQFKTRSTTYKQLLADLQTAIQNGDKTLVTANIAKLQSQQQTLQAAATKAATKKVAASVVQSPATSQSQTPMPSDPFEKAAYSQQRKDNAAWAKNGKEEADSFFRECTGRNWNKLTQDEKDSIWCYTWTYKCYQEPFIQGYYGGASWKADIGRKYIPKLTDALGKSQLDKDMWLQRYTDFAELNNWSKKGVNYRYSDDDMYNLKGKEGTQTAFWSFGSFKGGGLSQGRHVLINAYIPKGTCGMYIEPIAAWGDGAGNFKLGSAGHYYPPSWTSSYSKPTGALQGMNGRKYYQAPDWDGVSGQKTISDQCETLLQRGTISRITNVTKKQHPLNPHDYMWYIDVEVIGQNPTAKYSI